MIGGVLLLGGLIALAVLGVRKMMGRVAPVGTDGHAMRQFFQYLLLYGLLVVSAIGVSGLLSRLFEQESLTGADDSALARSVAFTVVGVPLLTLVTLWSRRSLTTDPAESTSFAWVFYLTAASLTSLIVAMTALSSLLAWATGLEPFDGRALADLFVWGAVWGGHWWLALRLTPAPLLQAHHVIGSLIGLVTAAVGIGTLLSGILEVWLGLDRPVLVAGGVDPILSGAVTLGVGAPVWYLYWVRTASGSARSPLWLAYVLLVGVGGGLVTALVSSSLVLHDVLVWLVGEPWTTDASEHFHDLPGAAGAAGVGLLVWWYHHAVLREGATGARTEVERVYEYLMALTGLMAAASGLTMVIVALIETLTGDAVVTGGDAVNTLLAAITLLVVGGPVWWFFWRRCQRALRLSPAEEASSPSRRIYLFLLLGLASVAAVIALLVGVYFLIEDILGGGADSGTVRRMRFPIGILLTAGTIAAYHWTVYGAERKLAVPSTRGPRFVLLVGPTDPGLADAIAHRTGGTVRSWARTDGVGTAWSAEEVMTAIEATGADEIIVVCEAGGPHAIPVRRR